MLIQDAFLQRFLAFSFFPIWQLKQPIVGSGYSKPSHGGEVMQILIKNTMLRTMCKSKQNKSFKWQQLPSFIQPTSCCILTGLHRQFVFHHVLPLSLTSTVTLKVHQSHKEVGQWLRVESEGHAPQMRKKETKERKHQDAEVHNAKYWK